MENEYEVKVEGMVDVLDKPFVPYIPMPAGTELEQAVALKYFQAIEKRECCYEWGEKIGEGGYTTNKTIADIFWESLTQEEKDTAFARMVLTFGYLHSNDCTAICQEVLGREYEWTELRKSQETWPDWAKK